MYVVPKLRTEFGRLGGNTVLFVPIDNVSSLIKRENLPLILRLKNFISASKLVFEKPWGNKVLLNFLWFKSKRAGRVRFRHKCI